MSRVGSIGRITAAKAELVESLPSDGLAVLNADDPRVAAMSRRTSARCVSFGTSESSDYRATDITGRGLDGFSFTLTGPGEAPAKVECALPGKHHVYPVLAAIAVALNEGMPPGDVTTALKSAGIEIRLTSRPAINGATLIDDSYNASPASVIAALDLLSETPGRKIAVLGHMRELGSAEAEGHMTVGTHSVATSDLLVVIGSDASLIADTASASGHLDVRRFSTPEEAASHLKDEIATGDHVLVKASRAVGLETLVEALAQS